MAQDTEYRRKERLQDAILESENCGEKATADQIQRWKDVGLPKPLWLTDRDWRFGDELSPKQILACRATALLMKPEQVAQITGLQPETVKQLLTCQRAQEEIEQVQNIFLRDHKRRLDDILPVAIATAFEIMTDPTAKDQVRADAAFKFMDRVLGKPLQQIEVNDNLLRKVFEQMDADTRNVIALHAQNRPPEAVALTAGSDVSTVEEATLTEDPIESWARNKL